MLAGEERCLKGAGASFPTRLGLTYDPREDMTLFTYKGPPPFRPVTRACQGIASRKRDRLGNLETHRNVAF